MTSGAVSAMRDVHLNKPLNCQPDTIAMRICWNIEKACFKNE
jgi:hypothetical protein